MANPETDEFTFTSAARSLALPIDGSDDEDLHPTQTRTSTERSWGRRSLSQPGDLRPRTNREKWLREAEKWQRRAVRTWFHFTPIQRAGIVLLNIILFVLTVLFL